jgi:ubiquinone/menaquinone biosynthesis C-methylase UbiE
MGENLKEAVRQEWSDEVRVGGWRKWHQKWAHQTRAATEALVEAAALQPGMRVLDLACGTGEPAITLAAAVGPSGQVIATDLVPGMLAAALENSQRAGVANVSFQPADAENLEFANESFDAVTCRFGLMFVPDAARALGEIRRVLKPGGGAAFVAWGPQEQNPMYLSTTAVLARFVEIAPPALDAPDGYRFAPPGKLSRLMREAGFRDAREQCLAVPWPWPGPVEEAWESHRELRGAPLRRILEKIPPEKIPQVEAEIYAAMRAYFDGQKVNFTAALVLASGIR